MKGMPDMAFRRLTGLTLFKLSFVLSLGAALRIVSLRTIFAITVSEFAHLTFALVEFTILTCCNLRHSIHHIRGIRLGLASLEAVAAPGIRVSPTVFIFIKKKK